MTSIFVFVKFQEKPSAEVVDKYADTIVDLLLSTANWPDDLELLCPVLNIIREILDCDKSMLIINE